MGSDAFVTELSELRAALAAYELVEVLGKGAVATVYGARHIRLGREVAIKHLAPEHLQDRDARERFAAEARLLASLDHPHVVRVFDYVETAGVCALVMERMHGGTLADRMRVARMGPAVACAVALGALHGLEHAHRKGVLHRDVKPENLLFDRGELVKVGDFGIAKVIRSAGARLTATAGTIGTPAFMAPEQVLRAAGPLSTATDVWGLAAVLYELLAGTPPYPRDEDTQLAELLLARVSEDPVPLREAAPEMPPEIEAVVMRALSREPAGRYPTAAAFADALENAVQVAFGRESLAATGIPIHRNEPAPPSALTVIDPIAPPLAPPRRRLAHWVRRPRAVAAGLILLAVVAASVVALTSSGGHGARRPDPLANLAPPPPGWPSKFAIGYPDAVAGPAGVEGKTGPGGIYYAAYGCCDITAGLGWQHFHDKPYPDVLVAQAARHHVIPYLTYYALRALGRNGKDDGDAVVIRHILVNKRLMHAYWVNVRAFLRSVGRANAPAAISIESGFWALLEQALSFSDTQPVNVPAVIGSSGLPELRGLPDNLPGFSDAWKRLRDRYAPKALLGGLIDVYGSGIDLSRGNVSLAAIKAAATSQARFWHTMSSTGIDYDFADFEVAFAEAGTKPTTPPYTDVQKEKFVAYLRQFARTVHVPIVVEAVPEGNTVMKTIDDKPWHYHDDWVQWLLADHFTHLRELRDAGVIGVQFGVAIGNTETCPCDAAHDGVTNGGTHGIVSRSPDDDGGYFAQRAAAYRHSGELALAPRGK